MQTVEGQDIKSTFPLSSVWKHVKREEKGLHFLLAFFTIFLIKKMKICSPVMIEPL